MKHTIPALALLAVASAAYAQSNPVKTAERELQAQFRKFVDAYRRHDKAALPDFYADDFQAVQPDGAVWNKKRQIAFNQVDQDATSHIRSATLTFLKSTLHGDTISSEVSEDWDCDFTDLRGEYGPKGKVYPIRFHQQGIYVHMKRAQSWRLKRLEIKEMQTTTGGKKLVPLKK